MSETKKSYQPTCEDYPEDDQVPAPRAKTTSKRAQSKPPPTTRKTSAPDTASIDSGYSSKTAATQDSGESGGASTKTLHPIKSNAPAAASLPPSRSASSDARRHSTSSTPTTKPVHPPTQTQQHKHIPPPIYPVAHLPAAVAPVPQPMASSPPCNCAKCVYKAQQQRAAHRYSPLDTPMDIHYPPFTQRQEPPLPSPTGHFPPSSYAPPPRRRLPSGGISRPRPVTYHEHWVPPPPPPPSSTMGSVPAEHYHINPSHHYLPPSAPQVQHYGAPDLIRRPSTTAAAAGPYAPPAYPHGQTHMAPPPPPPPPQSHSRPHLAHYDTEGAAHSSAMVHHMYGSAPRSNSGFLQQPQYNRIRRSTSPGNLGPGEARDRLLMPPPPPRLSTVGPVRSASTRRPSPSYEQYDDSYYPYDYEDDFFDGEDDYDEEDRDRTIRPRRQGSSRPTILAQHDNNHPHSTTSVPQRPSHELSRGRRRSSVGHRVLEKDRLTDAEDHIARTSGRAKEPLTAERVKKINRNSLDSSSRSHKSRGGSEKDGASSHVSKGDASTRIRMNQDNSFEIEGPGTVRVVPQDDGNHHFIVENAGGRETKYHKDGSHASRASRASNKSFASRASRSARPGEPVKEGRQKSGSDKAARRKAKTDKPEVVVEDGEARE